MANQILLGDCLDVLKTLPDASVDSIITDPPYGLGTREPTGEEIVQYLQGGDLDTSGDFMGKAWSIPPVAVWRECYRVLQPGGHLLCFGGTRTFDLISIGIRAAGFECRDTIASQFGVQVLKWIQGQGFPKSLNVKSALEKMGLSPEESAAWSGWGTSLKPCWEPIIVARKPIAESTVAKQVLATGTGALNIDACRVQTSSADLAEMTGRSGASSENAFPGASDAGIWGPKSSGRWPSNVLLTHAPGCRRTGTKKVDAPVINRFTDGAKPFGNGAGHEYVSEQQGDAEGKEEIAVYECVEPHTIELAKIKGWCLDITHAGFDEILGGFDHLQSLLADTHTLDTESTQSNVPACALLASSLQGSKGDCPACSRFYGEQFLLLQEAARASLQQLGDALELALDRVRLLRHNQRHQHDDLLTNGGASLGSSKCENIASSKSLGSSFSVGETPSHTLDIELEGCLNERLNEPLPNNTLQSSMFGGVRRVSSFVHCNACNDTELRLFFRESLALASRFLPGCVSIRTFMVSGCPVKALDEQSGYSVSVSAHRGRGHTSEGSHEGWKRQAHEGYVSTVRGHDDVGGASRFFPQFEQPDAPFLYCAKVCKRERDDGLPKGTNKHPTVKPLALMRWLVRLVTPKGGTVLDPYCGSGSTLVAAIKEGFQYIGIERDPEFHQVAELRVAAATPQPDVFDELEQLK